MTVLKKNASRFLSTVIYITLAPFHHRHKCSSGALCNHVAAWQFCSKKVSTGYFYYTASESCEYGCCYENTSSPCCAINAGLIAGAVIGSLVGLALLIGGICLLIHCANANTKRTAGVAPQVIATNAQYMQPIGYQPYYQASSVVYPPPPPPAYTPPTAEPLPPPIYVEGTRPPVDHQNRPDKE